MQRWHQPQLLLATQQQPAAAVGTELNRCWLMAQGEHWLLHPAPAKVVMAQEDHHKHPVLGMSIRKVTSLGSNLASVTDLKRIETPHSL